MSMREVAGEKFLWGYSVLGLFLDIKVNADGFDSWLTMINIFC